MKIEDVMREEKKEIRLTLRCGKEAKKWMDRNNISPQKLFDYSLKKLMENEVI